MTITSEQPGAGSGSRAYRDVFTAVRERLVTAGMRGLKELHNAITQA